MLLEFLWSTECNLKVIGLQIIEDSLLVEKESIQQGGKCPAPRNTICGLVPVVKHFFTTALRQDLCEKSLHCSPRPKVIAPSGAFSACCLESGRTNTGSMVAAGHRRPNSEQSGKKLTCVPSTFATVRARTRTTEGVGSRDAGLAMAFKLLLMAEKRWRKVTSAHLVSLVQAGVKFFDGKTCILPDLPSSSVVNSPVDDILKLAIHNI